MQLKQNHFLHFVVILVIVTIFALGISVKQMQLESITKDTNRLASSRLIVNALDDYKKHFQKYPEKLDEIKDFLSPIPVDPDTHMVFSYELTSQGYRLIIPQERIDDIVVNR